MFHQDWEPVVIRKVKPVVEHVVPKPKTTDEEDKKLKMYSKELADEMLKARCQLKISQAELAKRCNVVPGVIQEMESRKGIYNAELTNKVCKVLKIKVDKRFTY